MKATITLDHKEGHCWTLEEGSLESALEEVEAREEIELKKHLIY